ncbi:helix-turn-helix transcriptional regulator [Streptosporangium lutulentum]|uniref:DNA-binding transcriptional regulator AlpA n=1 Tax=Streptosporangium lutulentum TaxID=1461250 RepID=A0ABT9QPJ7_9ACTN|nr:hypothetical protein [Streptosporangium lutulentum]MDP9848680.1 putative DNA-binding transcriptional regulator AlpA [Streptosporangium lutulentum]
MEYEFRFVVTGASVDDVGIVDLLCRDLDAMLFRGGGVDLLDIAMNGENVLEAAMAAARTVVELVPSMRLLHLHRDLVGIPEIAERVGVTRQNVHQWVNGERRNDASPFPSPEGTAGRASVWLWVEVNNWLKQHRMGDEVNLPNRYEMSDIDSALNHELHLRTKLSIDRWRRNRLFGVATLYSANLEIDETEDELQVEDEFQLTWGVDASVKYKAAMQ